MFTYLQDSDREIFGHLEKQARAFDVLASALGYYVNELRHFSGQRLLDMAILVRAQGQSILQTADEMEALANRIQKEIADAQFQAFRREFGLGRPPRSVPDEKGGVE